MTPRKVLTPAEAIARARITPRQPGPARARGGLRGWIEWELIDRQGRAVKGGQQSNLILNTGLDYVASWALGNSHAGTAYGWQGFAAVGTGSTEPDVTDTELVAELARSNTTIASNTSVPTAGVGIYTVTKEFDFGVANGNLTEWGFAPASTGNLSVRELFRDELGDPVTVTKTSDFKLRITYSIELTITPAATPEPFTWTVTGLGAIGAEHTFNALALSSNRFSDWTRGRTMWMQIQSQAWAYGTSSNNVSGVGTIVMPGADAYVPGSYERVYAGDTVWGTAAGNVYWVSVRGGEIGTGRGMSWGFTVDVADRFTKDDEHIMTVSDFVTMSWARG